MSSREFQSTPPARGATIPYYKKKSRILISIHAPREGGDSNAMLHRAIMSDFNPRPPRGGRRNSLSTLGGKTIISIHAPREGGDGDKILALTGDIISIHAPREGGDFALSLPWS